MSLPTISLKALNNSVAKTGSNTFAVKETTAEAQFVVTLSEASTETISVQITSIDGLDPTGADDHKDYTGNKLKTLTFAPGETSKTYSLPILQDAFAEVEENIKIVLTDAVNAKIEKIENYLAIQDQNGIGVSVDQSEISVDEGAGYVTIGVRLDQASSSAVTVGYNTVDVDAQDRRDYTGLKNQSITFAAGETYKEVKVAIKEDNFFEGTEKFKFVLKNTPGVVVGDRVSTISILDNDDSNKGINIVKGDELDNNLVGSNAHKNFIAAMEGNDTILGGQFSDKIIGGKDTGTVEIDGAGNAVLVGGGDVITGAGGNDLFKYTTGEGADLVTDFTDNLDKLILKGAHSLVDVTNGTFVDFGGDQGVIVTGIASADLADDIVIVA